MRIELKDIHKRFGAVHANRGIDLAIEPGTIHGVLGENGAGKSTLMKILVGFQMPTSGEILLDDKPTTLRGPKDAAHRGIGMLFQDPLDFPSLTVFENFRVGLPGSPAEAADRLTKLSERFGFVLPPGRAIERLTVGERQQLEILRLVALGVEVLILDEPTTGITDLQKAALFGALRRLAREGDSVVLISHKLEDVTALCDRVTVLRDGGVAGQATRPLDTDHLLGLMFGSPPERPPRRSSKAGEPVLAFEGVSAPGGRAGLSGCSTHVGRGEVVALAGVEGSGQGVFLRLAVGLTRPRTGRVRRLGRATDPTTVAFLPTDRLEEGLVPGMTVREHFALHRRPTPWLVHRDTGRDDARRGIDRLGIRGAPDTPAEALSGGNQQRLQLSLLPEQPALLLLENPTRGLDLESAHGVWRELQRHCDNGTAIVFSSPELDEILQMADRVLVFHDGSVVLDTPTDTATAEGLARAIAGGAAP